MVRTMTGSLAGAENALGGEVVTAAGLGQLQWASGLLGAHHAPLDFARVGDGEYRSFVAADGGYDVVDSRFSDAGRHRRAPLGVLRRREGGPSRRGRGRGQPPDLVPMWMRPASVGLDGVLTEPGP